MIDRIRTLVSILERDPSSEEAMLGLEEIVTCDSVLFWRRLGGRNA